ARERQIAHAPLPLIRRPADGAPTPQDLASAHAAAVRAHLGAGSPVQVSPSSVSPGVLTALRPPADPRAPIAVVIPTKDNLLDLKHLVESLHHLAKQPDRVEIIILNNGVAEFRTQLEAATAAFPGVRIADVQEPFNWSRLSNLGAAM